MKHLPQLKISNEYLGYGIDENGREYEGYIVNGECKYFFTSDGEEMEDE